MENCRQSVGKTMIIIVAQSDCAVLSLDAFGSIVCTIWIKLNAVVIVLIRTITWPSLSCETATSEEKRAREAVIKSCIKWLCEFSWVDECVRNDELRAKELCRFLLFLLCQVLFSCHLARASSHYGFFSFFEQKYTHKKKLYVINAKRIHKIVGSNFFSFRFVPVSLTFWCQLTSASACVSCALTILQLHLQLPST